MVWAVESNVILCRSRGQEVGSQNHALASFQGRPSLVPSGCRGLPCGVAVRDLRTNTELPRRDTITLLVSASRRLHRTVFKHQNDIITSATKFRLEIYHRDGHILLPSINLTALLQHLPVLFPFSLSH